jgi:prepilin-type N-terminal cleavage/methylation domain-containing protein
MHAARKDVWCQVSGVSRISDTRHLTPDTFFRSAFTLVELLVVVSIIGVLVALLLPAIQSAREASRRGACINNMKQIALGILNYESSKHTLPPAFTPGDGAKQPYGPCNGPNAPATKKAGESSDGKKHFVLSFIMPYMEQQVTTDLIDFAQDYNATQNEDATHQDIRAFLCPSADTRKGAFATDYTTFVDMHEGNYCRYIENPGLTKRKRPVETLAGMLAEVPLQVRRVSDGLSKTFMFFESAGKPNRYIEGVFLLDNPVKEHEYQWASNLTYDIWGDSSESKCRVTTIMNCDNEHEIYSFHPGGAIFAHGDGSVDYVGESIDIDVFVCAFTRASNDVPGLE